MTSRRHLIALALLIPVALAALVAGTAGGSEPSTSGPGNSARAGYFDHVRDAVVNGAARDFAAGTGLGGPTSPPASRAGWAKRSTPPTIDRPRRRLPAPRRLGLRGAGAERDRLPARRPVPPPHLGTGAGRGCPRALLHPSRGRRGAGTSASPTAPSWGNAAATGRESRLRTDRHRPRLRPPRDPCRRRRRGPADRLRTPGKHTASPVTTGSGRSPNRGSRRGTTRKWRHRRARPGRAPRHLRRRRPRPTCSSRTRARLGMAPPSRAATHRSTRSRSVGTTSTAR